MTRSAPLRVVKQGETRAKTEKPLSLMDAVKAGDYLGELKALHRRIAAVVNESSTPARDLAALSRRQWELSREIQTLEAALAEDAVGEIDSEDAVFDPAAV